MSRIPRQAESAPPPSRPPQTPLERLLNPEPGAVIGYGPAARPFPDDDFRLVGERTRIERMIHIVKNPHAGDILRIRIAFRLLVLLPFHRAAILAAIFEVAERTDDPLARIAAAALESQPWRAENGQ